MTLDSVISVRQETVLPTPDDCSGEISLFLSLIYYSLSVVFVSLCPIAHYEASTQGDILSQPPHSGRLQLEATLLSQMTLALVPGTNTDIS